MLVNQFQGLFQTLVSFTAYFLRWSINSFYPVLKQIQFCVKCDLFSKTYDVNYELSHSPKMYDLLNYDCYNFYVNIKFFLFLVEKINKEKKSGELKS